MNANRVSDHPNVVISKSGECVGAERTLNIFLWRKQLMPCDSYSYGKGWVLFPQLKPRVKSFSRMPGECLCVPAVMGAQRTVPDS